MNIVDKDDLTGWRNPITGHGTEASDQSLANPRNWHTRLKAPGARRRPRRTGHVVDGHARIALAISKQEPTVVAARGAVIGW